MSDAYQKLVQGHRFFREHLLPEVGPFYERMATEGQSPKILIIACCDSRVDLFRLTQSSLGDLFVVRNVANLVPVYAPMSEHEECHGTNAAIQYAVMHLQVTDIVIVGHSGCGGIASLLQGGSSDHAADSFIRDWMNIARPVLDKLDHAPEAGVDASQRVQRCEQLSVLNSVENCYTFPWIKARVDQGDLSIHGWYLDIISGSLWCYDQDTGVFALL